MELKRTIVDFNIFWIVAYSLILGVMAGRSKFNPQVSLMASGSQQVPKVGYLYPVPAQSVASATRAQLNFPPLALPRPSSNQERLPSASAQEPSIQQLAKLTVEPPKTPETEVDVPPKEDDPPTTTAEEDVMTTTLDPIVRAEAMVHHHHHPLIDAIDVACGKDKMTVRVTFDAIFDGMIYAKGHYADTKCRFVAAKSGRPMYQFELTTGECGVSFIDDGLTEGRQAYVEALLVIIFEPGVQEAWDASRKIRCLWEGSLEQTVTFPLAVNMLEQKLLTFSGDTASVSLEIQAGDGPRATPVQGLVRIGDMLTAVVTVQGDSAFDILVRNCVATDGTAGNRILLSDTRGCATKPKLMGGWVKEKGTGGMMSFAKLSAFKFPDVMDLFLECTVSLCKGSCEECPATEYLELHIPANDEEEEGDSSTTTTAPSPAPETIKATESPTTSPPTPNITETVAAASMRIDVKASSQKHQGQRKRPRRSIYELRAVAEGVSPLNVTRSVSNPPEESLKLRRVVHVVGPDDFPEFSFGSFAASSSSPSATIYGTPNGTNRLHQTSSDCFSLLGVISAISVTALLVLISVAIYGILRRQGHKY